MISRTVYRSQVRNAQVAFLEVRLFGSFKARDALSVELKFFEWYSRQFDALLGMEEEEEEEEEGKGVTCDGKDRIWYKYILFFMMFCMISDGKRLARRPCCLGFVFFIFFLFGHCVGYWFSGTTLPFLIFWWLEGEGEKGGRGRVNK